VHEKCSHVRDAAGRVVSSVGMVQDVTERKRAELALAESEQRVRRKLESLLSPQGNVGQLELADIIEFEHIQEMMDDFHKIAGIPMAVSDAKGKVLVGAGWQDICTKFHRSHPETSRNCIESDVRLSAGLAAGQFKLYKCKNGLWDAATPIMLGDKRVGSVFSGQFFFDDETPDRDFFTRQARRYGFPEKDYLAALDRVPRLSRSRVHTAMGFFLKLSRSISDLSWRNIQIAREASQRRLAEAKLRQTKENLEQTVAERTKELAAANETLRQQIDEKARLIEQLQQTQKMEAVGLLAGGIAHDFNNVVATISGNNYFLLEGLPKGSPLHLYSREIARSADLAASLTRQLLAISRKQVVQPRVLDVNSVLISMSKMLGRLVGKNIRIEIKPHASLWPVKMDSGQLEQIVMNLSINARDAMPKGGALSLATANKLVRAGRPAAFKDVKPGSYICLEVRDTGVGMDAATQARIFEPFFTTKQAGRGTGLGLAVVQRIVQQYQGHLSVESQPGKGTLFRILIPSAKGGAEAMLPGEAPGGGQSGHESVLVVEDNEAFARIITKTLEQKGYRVFCAGSAKRAAAHFRKSPADVDLLLTDIVMPGMDGTELARRLKAWSPGLRVIYMSGYPGDAMDKVLGTSGAVLLEKPFSPDKLLEAVRRVLDRSQGDFL
ncbi:MAG: PocR ligand-binding domain-containing protein, partial [Elusimicrobia bacterium]|nr:PocR ligand-binding domain-containing protein [Elusimicrobiota bacterium]